jgi:hypothetical protein
MPVTPATWEAEEGRSLAQGQPEKVRGTLSQKQTSYKRAEDVNHVGEYFLACTRSWVQYPVLKNKQAMTTKTSLNQKH